MVSSSEESTLHRLALSLRAGTKLAMILAASALLMPLQAGVLVFTRGPRAFVLPRLWHRCLRHILGISVEVEGVPCMRGRTLYVGNHVSHFDIVLLGSVLRTRFIAKDDMRSWPGIPFIAGLQQTVFISRRARDAAAASATLSADMGHGNNLLLFAEGTTSAGKDVAPFKSSLFSLFVGGVGQASPAWTVQPFTLVLLGVDGHALDSDADRDRYAFHGDMDAGAHVKSFLRGTGARLRLTLHPPLQVATGTDCKALAALTHDIVASALQNGPSGA